jgi:hypothetical protein
MSAGVAIVKSVVKERFFSLVTQGDILAVIWDLRNIVIIQMQEIKCMRA